MLVWGELARKATSYDKILQKLTWFLIKAMTSFGEIVFWNGNSTTICIE